MVSSRAVRSAQRALLLAQVFYGLGLILPTLTPLTFLDYADDYHVQLWMWGMVIVSASAVGLLSELLTGSGRGKRRIFSTLTWLCHLVLTGVCAGLAAAALAYVLREAHGNLLLVLGSLRQAVLIGLLGHFNFAYARRLDLDDDVASDKQRG